MGYIIGGIVIVIGYVLCCSGGTITKKVCESDGFYHNVTYEKAFTGSAGKQLKDEPTSEMCFCTGVNGQISSPLTSGALRPHESNCRSADTTGNQQPISSQAASGSTSGSGGGGGPSTGTGENQGPP